MQVVASMKGHGRTVRSVCFLPDGGSVVSGSFDMTVRIWPLR
jgi:WD40 repeat protein